ncbi:MAG: oligoendopeptidase F family protein, partial [bacterium]|nr:oligoendopeptidase F family protein [bacterium]
IASTALADTVLNGGKKEQTRYLNFLKRGGTQFPLDTLKEAGVDLTTPQPIETAISRFSEIVAEMEKIARRKEQ